MTACVGPELRPETEVPIYTTGKLFLTHKMTVCEYSHFIYAIINRNNVLPSQNRYWILVYKNSSDPISSVFFSSHLQLSHFAIIHLHI